MNALTLVTIAVLQSGNIQANVADTPDLAMDACKDIGLLVGRFSGLIVTESEGTVHDGKTGSDHYGCRLVGAGTNVEYREDKWPHNVRRMRMTSDMWQEDISRAADGAGSTAFAVRKGDALCLFSAAWNITDSSERESATGEYRFEVCCFEVNEAG
jgi:hypothetical protein